MPDDPTYVAALERLRENESRGLSCQSYRQRTSPTRTTRLPAHAQDVDLLGRTDTDPLKREYVRAQGASSRQRRRYVPSSRRATLVIRTRCSRVRS